MKLPRDVSADELARSKDVVSCKTIYGDPPGAVLPQKNNTSISSSKTFFFLLDHLQGEVGIEGEENLKSS